MDKQKMWKGLGAIALIIILVSLASRFLLGSSETLSEYAKKNGIPTTKTELTTEESENLSPSENNAYTINEDEVSEESSLSMNEEPQYNPNRITYSENFYYEPLPENVKERITGISYPEPGSPCEITYDDLVYVHILYYDFSSQEKEGELICNKAIGQDLVEIFYDLYDAEYQLGKVCLIDEYAGDDTASMEDNNTSCFNYRVIDDTTKLSLHAYGLAIDLNPYYNPYIKYNTDGSLYISPKGSEPYADRASAFPYKIDENDLCYKLFIKHGFTWGGNWNSCKDYQHFQKKL